MLRLTSPLENHEEMFKIWHILDFTQSNNCSIESMLLYSPMAIVDESFAKVVELRLIKWNKMNSLTKWVQSLYLSLNQAILRMKKVKQNAWFCKNFLVVLIICQSKCQSVHYITKCFIAPSVKSVFKLETCNRENKQDIFLKHAMVAYA